MHIALYKRLKSYRDSGFRYSSNEVILDLLKAVIDLSDEVDRLLNRIEELEE